MKNILLLQLVFVATTSLGQVSNTIRSRPVSNFPKVNDSTIQVVNANSENSKKVAYYLNNELVSSTIFINPNIIEGINVVHDTMELYGVKYYGKIFIKTKLAYKPKIISLTSLKEKYTNLQNQPSIFMIDGIIINEDYDHYIVDENFILKIIIDKIQNEKQNINIGLIKILTRSEENIRKSKNIIIRGEG